jgi:AGZA family xanthine/uracil permease-like MFS transporter
VTEAEDEGLLERRFELSARAPTLRTEILAGVTTFLTMAYIVLVNPAILGQAGMPVAAVAAATCLAAAFASILMGFIANVPLALAPGMGLNAYFSFTVVQGMGVPWPVAPGLASFISGVAFLILTFAGIRQLIISAIPPHLFAAVAAGSVCSSPSSPQRMPDRLSTAGNLGDARRLSTRPRRARIVRAGPDPPR